MLGDAERSAAEADQARLAAIVALVVGAATIALAVAVSVTEFPRGLGLLGCVVVAGAAAWYGLLRRGVPRVVGLTVAALALAGAVALLVTGESLLAELLVVAGVLVTLAAATAAWLHADAARRGPPVGLVAGDVPDLLPATIATTITGPSERPGR